MKFSFHNKLEVEFCGKKTTYFNSFYKTVFDRLISQKSYGEFIAIGIGEPSLKQTEFKLTTPIKAYRLETTNLQTNPKFSDIFIKKTVIIDDFELNNKYIKEIGLCNTKDDLTLINYFSLITEETPDGILKEENKSLVLSIYIYLNITDNDLILTLGNNDFLKFLLGLGLSDSINISRGYITSKNQIERCQTTTEKFPCSLIFNEENFSIEIQGDLGEGKTNEIVFSIGEKPFARTVCTEYHTPVTYLSVSEPKRNHVIDLGEDIKNCVSITKQSNSELEASWTEIKYSNKLGDKVYLPFYNLFNKNTPRFLSRDGDKIFFICNNTIYGYQNENYSIYDLHANNLSIANITKIISFDSFVFVVSKTQPFISAFLIKNRILSPIELNFGAFDAESLLNNIFDVEITYTKNNMLMIGVITKSNHFANVLYLDYDSQNELFIYNSNSESNDYEFDTVISMFKNNFTDSSVIFLKGDERAAYCRIVTFDQNKQKTDLYSILAYYYTHDAIKTYSKGRAVIVEKSTSPKLWLYYYPQMYRYTLSLFENESENYLSTNLLYLIQKSQNNDFKIYNLVGYDTPNQFISGIPTSIEKSSIVDFEFLNDILLIFTNNKSEPILGYNLILDQTLIENISSNEDSYLVNQVKYVPLGMNNKGVSAKFTLQFDL
ncbi:MAG: hypothetical protein IJ538_02160 [Clostridia bacterium]|nr:hypothetical protein [Clostridia bacterium]